MTKEKLEKEAREDVDSLNGIDLVSSTMIAIDRYGAYKIGRYDGYLAGAEPREKQIQIDAEQIRALQKQNGELTDELTKKAGTNHQLVEQLAKLSEENAELKCECRRCVYADSPCVLSDYGKDKNGICDHFKDVFDENAELKKELEQAEKVKVVEHFEAYGQCRDSRRIAELEAENERLTVSYETLKLHDEEEIEMLKSENAELKKELEITRRCWYDQKNISLDTNCKLHKAKEIIKGLLDLLYEEGYKTGFHNEMKEAEQFLSEVEK